MRQPWACGMRAATAAAIPCPGQRVAGVVRQIAIEAKHRSHLPMPNAIRVGMITCDAKDPDSKFPSIEQLRPPKGAIRASLGRQ